VERIGDASECEILDVLDCLLRDSVSLFLLDSQSQSQSMYGCSSTNTAGLLLFVVVVVVVVVVVCCGSRVLGCVILAHCQTTGTRVARKHDIRPPGLVPHPYLMRIKTMNQPDQSACAHRTNSNVLGMIEFIETVGKHWLVGKVL
jgi:hypothetical protein